MSLYGFSDRAIKLRESVTHGTKANIEELNKNLGEKKSVIDLSIGTLDEKADASIDAFVTEFIAKNSTKIHEFSPVTGFDFVRESISERVIRLRNIYYSPVDEVMITPGGIKGAISVVFHTFINPGDEVIVPIPNWPHYADMISLHGGSAKFLFFDDHKHQGLRSEVLKRAINNKTKIIILGDCINPTGKIYSEKELIKISEVIAIENVRRNKENLAPIHVLYDCPYESHIFDGHPPTISKVKIEVDSYGSYSMRDCTTIVTGPGKTYGMHGARIGYICTTKVFLKMMARVQVNLNSFASTYAQVATHAAMQASMDLVARKRAMRSRQYLSEFAALLNKIPGVSAPVPEGGYFVFADLTNHKSSILRMGYKSADEFLLNIANVASISGAHFAENVTDMEFFVRMNCGRDRLVLREAASRIRSALSSITEVDESHLVNSTT